MHLQVASTPVAGTTNGVCSNDGPVGELQSVWLAEEGVPIPLAQGELVVNAATSQRRQPRRKRSEVRQRTEVVVFRLLPAELEMLRAAADDRNVSLSELVRSSVLSAIAS